MVSILTAMPPRPVHRIAQIFAVLREPEVRAIWLSDWISDVGNFITFIALAVFVHDLTGSVTAVGLALALRALPRVVIRPFGGVLADRMDRRRLMIASNLIRAVLVAALPFTHAAWQAYILSLASSIFGPIHSPARAALLAEVAPEGKLVRALAVTETTHEALHTIGPAIGGLAVFFLGARDAFFLDAASFVVAAVIQLGIAPRGRPKPARSKALRDVTEGFSAVFRTPAVRSYVLLSAAVALASGGIVALLLIYVRDFLGRPEGMYGVALSVAGAGTVVISLVIAARDDHHPRTIWALASVPGVAVFALVWLRPSFIMLMPIALAFGLADSSAGIPLSATVAEAMPNDVRGRVYATDESIYDLASAVGSLGFAWLAEPARLGVVASMTLAAGTGAVLGAIVLAAGGVAAIAGFERGRLAEIKAAAEPAKDRSV
jgi:MFS transporter, NRE family, putaive nickel resistance protein